MRNVIELIYKTSQENQLFLLLVIALFLILIAIIYVIHSQTKQIRRQQEKEEVVEENINYNIYSEEKEKPILEQMVEEKEPVIQVEEKQEEVEEEFNLRNITKELESLPKERTIQLTPYELEQEEQAIISYDELVTQSIPRLEISQALRDEIEEEYVYDVDKKYEEKEIINEQVEEELPKEKEDYVHEETFLDNLRNLKDSLN